MTFDAVVIGGGAAGLFCAAEAGKRGRRVLVLEHNAEPGRKILISGGGRCNFTNLEVTAANFVSKNPHFAKSALAGYTPRDFVGLVRSHKIDYYEKKAGQLFCRDSARRIVEMLLTECARAKVEIRTRTRVDAIETAGSDFIVRTNTDSIRCEKLVIASGGLSFPKVGATGFGYEIARQFGLEIVPTRPALVPLSFDGISGFGPLAGISVDALVSIGKTRFRDNILFTHHGLSGPAILQISNYWQRGTEVTIDLVPETEPERIFADHPKQLAAGVIGRLLPKRLADFIAADTNRPLASLSQKELANLTERIKNWKLNFDRTEGYHKAEVTAGGVSTAELSSQTMESKRVPGLFFIGEVIDVTGWLGGYNFQWAWASANACSKAL